MPKHESYILRIWQSRTLGGWQWSARVEDLADGSRERFADRNALLTYLEAIVMRRAAAEFDRGGNHDHAPPDPR
jgi:hypothetical protein